MKDCVEKPSFHADDTRQTPGISSDKSLTLYVKASETSGLSQMSTDSPSQTLEPSVATVVKGMRSSVALLYISFRTQFCCFQDD